MLLEILPTVNRSLGTLVVVLLIYGLWNRRRPRIHMPVMIGCFVIDVANVVMIEVGRLVMEGEGAVARSVRSLTQEGLTLLNFHIAVSLLTLVCYGIAVGTGLRLYRRGRGRGVNRTNAVIFLLARATNFVTSFLV